MVGFEPKPAPGAQYPLRIEIRSLMICSAEIPFRTHIDCHRCRERHDCRRVTGGDHECGICGVGLTITSRRARAALRRRLRCNTARLRCYRVGLGLQMALSGVFGTGNSILMIALCPGHNIMP